jgi:hypothetical protein
MKIKNRLIKQNGREVEVGFFYNGFYSVNY